MAEETPSWLNLDFIAKILRNSENDNSIRVIDVFSNAASTKGDNYTSDVIRVTVELLRDKSDRKEKKSIFIKIAPQEGIKKDFIDKAGIFDTEISMLSDTVEKMNDLLHNKRRFNPRLLYFQKEPITILALEDLAVQGFRMADRQSGLDMDHIMIALRSLGRFHAASVALVEKEPEQKKNYRRGMFYANASPEFSFFFYSNMKALVEVAQTWPELSPRHIEKLRRFAKVIYDKGMESAACKDSSFNVINHGDFWVNNMLFRYDDDGKPIDHIFVDFQISYYSSPVIDLLYFLNSSAKDELLESSKTKMLEEYVHVLDETMKELGCKTRAITMEELKREMRDRAVLEMIYSFSILPLMLVDKSEVRDIEEMFNENNKSSNPAMKSSAFRKVITKRIMKFDERGLLDL